MPTQTPKGLWDETAGQTGHSMDERDKVSLHLELNERWIELINAMISEGYCPRDVTDAMATALGSALIQTHGADAWKTAFAIYAPLRDASNGKAPAEVIN